MKLKKKTAKLDDYCKICQFLTIFRQKDLKFDAHTLILKLLLKVDDSDPGHDHLDFQKMASSCC